MSIFLEQSDVAILTGKKLKAQQVDVLRGMGILFYVNAAGHPVVPKSAVEGLNKPIEQQDKPWVPAMKANHG
jgi:hypothetical protein